MAVGRGRGRGRPRPRAVAAAAEAVAAAAVVVVVGVFVTSYGRSNCRRHRLTVQEQLSEELEESPMKSPGGHAVIAGAMVTA